MDSPPVPSVSVGTARSASARAVREGGDRRGRVEDLGPERRLVGAVGVGRWVRHRQMLPPPGSATKGTSISSAVSDPCRLTSRLSPVSAGSMKAIGACGIRATSPRRATKPAASGPPNRPSSTSLVPPLHPGGVGVAGAGRVEQVGGGAGPGVQPAEPALARDAARTRPMISRPRSSSRGPTSIWPWSAVTTRTAPVGQLGGHVGHHPVDRPELGVVVLAETAGVGHLVDAVVVGVDEGLALADEPADLDGQGRGHPVAVQRRGRRGGRR